MNELIHLLVIYPFTSSIKLVLYFLVTNLSPLSFHLFILCYKLKTQKIQKVSVAIDMVNRRLSDFEGQGSGWRLHGIDRVTIQCTKHTKITGASYIPILKFIKSRKATLNVKNKNYDLCFLYSILAHIHSIHWSQHLNEVCHYKPFLHELNYSGLTFSLKIRQIRKFKDQNPQISINVLYYDSETSTIMPLWVTKYCKTEHHVNLFVLYDDGAKNKQDDAENPQRMQRLRHMQKKQKLWLN